MKSHSLKPFDNGKYLSEEDALKLLESIPIPKDNLGSVNNQKPEQPETPPPPVSITSIDNFVVLQNIRCVDAGGNVFEQYPELHIAKDVVRRADGTHECFTTYGAIRHFEQQGLFLPSFALSCNIVAALFQEAVEKSGTGYKVKNAELKKVLDQYLDHGAGHGLHAQNTLIDWGRKKIIHYPQDSDFPQHNDINKINQSRPFVAGLPTAQLDGLYDIDFVDIPPSALITESIRNLTGLEDPTILARVGGYFRKPARIWTSHDSRPKITWFGCNYQYLVLNGNVDIFIANAARGVSINAASSRGSP